MEQLASLVGYYPYRCGKCSRRFQTFRYSFPEPASPPTGTEKAIAATQGASRWKQRRREMTRAPSIGD